METQTSGLLQGFTRPKCAISTSVGTARRSASQHIQFSRFDLQTCCLQHGDSPTTYLHEGSNLPPPLNNILNWILASTYLHKGSDPPPLRNDYYIL